MQQHDDSRNEQAIRPLARLKAHTLTTEELAKVSGGWTFGLSNFGGAGDKDLVK